MLPLYRRLHISFSVRSAFPRPDFSSLPQHPNFLVASVICLPFLILWCFDGLRLPLLVESRMLGSTLCLVGDGIKPSGTHIIITYSQKLPRLDSSQALQRMSRYKLLTNLQSVFFHVGYRSFIENRVFQIWFCADKKFYTLTGIIYDMIWYI
jgi:hypothetical protein